MTIPDYQTVMLPLLRLAADGEEHSLREAIERLADEFGLNEEERKELLPSGSQARFDNRVGWARTYMKKAGLVDSPRRGHFRITARGLEALQENPKTINVKFLERYPEFQEFRTRSTPKAHKSGGIKGEVPPEQTPVKRSRLPTRPSVVGLWVSCWSRLWGALPTSSSGWWSTSW